MEYKTSWNFVYEFLKERGIDEPSDVDYIFSEILRLNRAELKLIKEISIEQFNAIMDITKKRATHKPLQRIFGKTNFYGLDFELNEDTLIPRLDTEILVDQVIKYANKQTNSLTILDLCTGSGCVAISVAKNTESKVYAVDINSNALSMAVSNAKNNGANVEFIQSNMFNDIPSDLKFDVIISNPPYIVRSQICDLERTVKDFEPYIALDGGVDGFDFYRIISKHSFNHLNKNGKIFLEIGDNQSKSIANIFDLCYNNFEIVKDLHGNERVFIANAK